jgi:GTP-binding protein HflX
MVWNKADLLPVEEVETLLRSRGGVAISAASREGLASLLAKADTTLFAEGATEAIGVV